MMYRQSMSYRIGGMCTDWIDMMDNNNIRCTVYRQQCTKNISNYSYGCQTVLTI